MEKRDAILGCLLGEAIGDSMGLWCEGLSPHRQRRFESGALHQRFLFGHGMISDDTEHALMTAQALIVSAGEPTRFTSSLAWRLRGWLLAIPAGIGLATLRSIVKLWLGFSPSHSGVFSAGNGPCMRAGILGISFSHDFARLRELVRRSTRMTHSDPKAEWGARTIALAAACAFHTATEDDLPGRFRAYLDEHLETDAMELRNLLERALASAAAREETATFAKALGLTNGVTGYTYHTVPVVVQAWLRHPRDLRAALTSIIRCGGDTDTTGAILGSILGCAIGKQGLPTDWLDAIWEWPCGVKWMEQVGMRLAEVLESGTAQAPIPKNYPMLALRKCVFAMIVLAHGFRRLLPPYGSIHSPAAP
jgi:ADP-ribosyl-[dinitrogen reductase] hydrolase